MHCLTALLLCLGAEPNLVGKSGPDTLVVCPQVFRAELQPWLKHRQAQGHQLEVINTQVTAKQLRAEIMARHRGGRLQNVLLIGDVPTRRMTAAERSKTIPTHYVEGKVNIFFGSEKWIASDNYYADMDGDQLPDLAVGRLPADTPQDLRAMVHKILHYEKSNSGNWRNQIDMVAGVGGFGGVVDHALETVTRKFLADGVPSEYRLSLTFASWRSPFCPDPREFHATTVNLLNRGSLFFVYTGHGQRTYLDRVSVPGAEFPILEHADAPRLSCKSGHPIAIFLACYTGAYDFERDCLAEELLRSPGGPVAVFAGSRVTMPYAMGVMANGLMDEYFRKGRRTMGELVKYSKRQLVEHDNKAHRVTREHRQLADTLARLVSPKPKLLKEERFEHLWLYNLLGDPLLRVPHAQRVRLACDCEQAAAGDLLKVSGTLEMANGSLKNSRGFLQLVNSRETSKHQLEKRTKFDDSPKKLSAYQQTYRKANDWLWSQQTIQMREGRFETTLRVPKGFEGPVILRAFISPEEGAHALGALTIAPREVAEE